MQHAIPTEAQLLRRPGPPQCALLPRCPVHSFNFWWHVPSQAPPPPATPHPLQVLIVFQGVMLFLAACPQQPSQSHRCVTRCFNDPIEGHWQISKAHIGTHPKIMTEMSNHPRFRTALGTVSDALKRYMRAGPSAVKPFTVAVFCRSGQHRSVAMATFLYHCLHWGMGMELVSFDHLTDFWRGTCRGTCPACRDSRMKSRRPDVTTAVDWFRENFLLSIASGLSLE